MEFNATFIVAFVSFIIFTVIMNMILYKPLSSIVEQRQGFVDEHQNEASIARARAQAILDEKAQKLEESKLNARKIIADKTVELESQKTALTTEAQRKASQVIDVAKTELALSNSQAQQVLSGHVVDLAKSISSKILGADIAVASVDNELISKIMQES